jgi:hypothetical protein
MTDERDDRDDRDDQDGRDGGGGFRWNLTPVGADATPPEPTPPAPTPPAPALPAPMPPAPAPTTSRPPADNAPVDNAPLDNAPAGAARAEKPPVDDWDVPTAASPVIGRSVFPLPPPTGPPALLPPPYIPRPPALGSPIAPSTFPAPLDTALEGVTEVLGARPAGLPDPVDESPETSAIDVLFGESKFVEYDTPLSPAPRAFPPPSNAVPPTALPPTALPPTALPPTTALPGFPPPPSLFPPMSSLPFDTLPPLPASTLALYEGPRTPSATAPWAVGPRAMPRPQKILIGVAGALVAGLALVALFLLGMRIGQNAPTAGATADPSPTPSATAPGTPAPGTPAADAPAGPLDPGEYSWDELLGGECLTFYESPWQDGYTVVDCAELHTGQLLSKSTLEDGAGTPYPAATELQSAIIEACSAATVIDYSSAEAVDDIQLEASYPATAEKWDAGDRTAYCFVSRAGRGDLTGSLAVPAA